MEELHKEEIASELSEESKKMYFFDGMSVNDFLGTELKDLRFDELVVCGDLYRCLKSARITRVNDLIRLSDEELRNKFKSSTIWVKAKYIQVKLKSYHETYSDVCP